MPAVACVALGLAAAAPRTVLQPCVRRGTCGLAAQRAAAVRLTPLRAGRSQRRAEFALAAARPARSRNGSGGTEPAVLPGSGSETAPARVSRRKGADGNAAAPAPAAGAAPAQTRAKRAPQVGVYGETTATGHPKPDERTVARLVELNWCDTAGAAEALLTKHNINNRFPYETAGPMIDWLIDTLGEEEHSSGRCRAAQAVYKFPIILASSTSALQRGWETVVLSRDAGGLGLPETRAQQRVAAYPQVLVYDTEYVTKRAEFLETLGVIDGRAAIAGSFPLLGMSEDKLRSGAEWLQSQGLDVALMASKHPPLLWLSPRQLSPKLDFLRSVAGLGTEDILSSYLTYSLEARIRPRYFYALQHGGLKKYAFSSLMVCSDEVFLKRMCSLDDLASLDEEDAYKAHIASPPFRAYMEEQEQAIRARRSRAKQ